MENRYLAEQSYEQLETHAATNFDRKFNVYRMKAKDYIELHKLAFLKHLTLCAEVNTEQYDTLNAIYKAYEKHIDPKGNKDDILKTTKRVRQQFLMLIAPNAMANG